MAEDTRPHTFDRDLQSLIHQPGFEAVKGLVIGRFQKASGMTEQLLEKIIRTKKELDDIPIIAGADFGHTSPQITFPIGGDCKGHSNWPRCATEDNKALSLLKCVSSAKVQDPLRSQNYGA